MGKPNQEDKTKRQADQTKYKHSQVTHYDFSEAYRIDLPSMEELIRVIKKMKTKRNTRTRQHTYINHQRTRRSKP